MIWTMLRVRDYNVLPLKLIPIHFFPPIISTIRKTNRLFPQDSPEDS